MNNPIQKLMSSGAPIYMGILNVTPDSFSDGLQNASTDDFLNKAKQLIHDGAHIIDVGGESTRPDADVVDLKTEQQRVIPFLKAFRTDFPDFPISLDTKKYEVAKEALAYGVQIINDVSCLQDERFVELVMGSDSYYVLMHARGNSQNMTKLTDYDGDVLLGIEYELKASLDRWQHHGGDRKRVIVDLGFGFAKTPQQCVEMMSGLDLWQSFECPLLLGISRKRFLQQYTGENESCERDQISAELALKAFKYGFRLIRTHNVALTKALFDSSL